ncbi:unnamed protein product [Protopolystoma xenopodis]|uniref:Uncharacterized protein n=1 Tax=Protopolystoma xenopodis TaxID=117903 RepID=A0A3S5CL28_9PLAT|nr:unnamed protein product [Protopolystoma xenopodis]
MLDSLITTHAPARCTTRRCNRVSETRSSQQQQQHASPHHHHHHHHQQQQQQGITKLCPQVGLLGQVLVSAAFQLGRRVSRQRSMRTRYVRAPETVGFAETSKVLSYFALL